MDEDGENYVASVDEIRVCEFELIAGEKVDSVQLILNPNLVGYENLRIWLGVGAKLTRALK